MPKRGGKYAEQCKAALSDKGYTARKHASLYAYDGKPKACDNNAKACAFGIARLIGGSVEAIADIEGKPMQGARAAYRVIGGDDGERNAIATIGKAKARK